MQRVGEILDGLPRVSLHRGPYDGRDVLVFGDYWPAVVHLGGEHYVHEQTSPGRYVHVGRCGGCDVRDIDNTP